MTPKEVQQAERLAKNAENQAAQDAWPQTPLEKEIEEQKDTWLMDEWESVPAWPVETVKPLPWWVRLWNWIRQ